MRTEALVARPAPAPWSVGGLTFHNVLELETVELLGPGQSEVLVEVASAGLCHSDVSVLTGDRPRPLPMVLGHEASGTVREVGLGVRHIRSGDTVVLTFVPSCQRCAACRGGRPVLCEAANTTNRNGTLVSGARPFRDRHGDELNQHLGVSAFSRFTVVAEESVIPVATSAPASVLALLGCAALTGVGAVLNRSGLQPGQSAAVFGCGGVGLAVILGARAAGASPIVAVDVTPLRLDWAKRAGADACVEWDADAARTIRELTHGGVAVAFEAAGAIQSLRSAYEATAIGGTTVVIGLANPQARLELSPSELVGTERALVGCYMGSAIPRRDVPLLLGMYERGRLPIDLLVGASFRLDEPGPAIETLLTGAGGRVLFDLTDIA